MYVARIPNRGSNPTYLIRHDRRVGKKIVKKTILNITPLPLVIIEGIRILLRGGLAVKPTEAGLEEAFRFRSSARHGHVAAVLGTIGSLGLPNVLHPKRSRRRNAALALIASRILDPKNMRATKDALHHAGSVTTLGKELGVEHCETDELRATTVWLHERKAAIEGGLARKHLKKRFLVLCDVSGSGAQGHAMDSPSHGDNRDRSKGRRQIIAGLLTTEEGCPVGVEVLGESAAHPGSLGAQVRQMQERFGVKRLVLLADRGFLSESRSHADLKPAGLDWIAALSKDSIRKIVDRKHIQASHFDAQDLVEVTTGLYPGERIILRRDSFVAQESARNREALLQATEAALEDTVRGVQRTTGALKEENAIALQVGKAMSRRNTARFFRIYIGEGHFHYTRDEAFIAQDAALDGMFAIRTSLKEHMPGTLVEDYERLATANEAFQTLKVADVPQLIRHRNAPRVICHVFLCMLAYYVQWHMKQRLAPMLMPEEDPEGERVAEMNPVQTAKRFTSADDEVRTKRNATRDEFRRFKALMDHLSDLRRTEIIPKTGKAKEPLHVVCEPSEKQQRAFDLLGIKIP